MSCRGKPRLAIKEKGGAMDPSFPIKHLKRYKEIAALLWKYGRSDLASQMDLEAEDDMDESEDGRPDPEIPAEVGRHGVRPASKNVDWPDQERGGEEHEPDVAGGHARAEEGAGRVERPREAEDGGRRQEREERVVLDQPAPEPGPSGCSPRGAHGLPLCHRRRRRDGKRRPSRVP